MSLTRHLLIRKAALVHAVQRFSRYHKTTQCPCRLVTPANDACDAARTAL